MLTVIGTPYYMAPEIYIGGGYDQRVDMWALGVTLFKMVAGYTPFESEYHSETVANILKIQPKFSYSRWSKFSSHFKKFVSQLLTKVEDRITIEDAKRHLWFQENELKSSSEKKKIFRSNSHKLLLHQDFHKQFKEKQMSAIAKEDNQLMSQNM